MFWRLSHNWLELAVRFVVPQRGVRESQDAIRREILGAPDAARIEIASGTCEIVGLPPVRVETVQSDAE